MSAISKYRGHNIEFVNNVWIYCDIKKPTIEYQDRNCAYCDKPRTVKRHDQCVRNLKFAMNACCGHGETIDAYIQFSPWFRISGLFALIVMYILKYFKNKKC